MSKIEFTEKQLAIITTAERLFSIKGFEGTSVRDIAQEAGINVAMISYYFGSKEKLMEAVFEEKTRKMRLTVETLLQNTEMSSLEKVNILIEEYVSKILGQPQFHKIMLLEQITDKPGGVSDLILGLKKRNQVVIKKLILEGQKRGEFRKNIDVVLMMATMVGVVSQMIIGRRFYREINNLEHLSEEELTTYMRKKLTAYIKNLFKTLIVNEA